MASAMAFNSESDSESAVDTNGYAYPRLRMMDEDVAFESDDAGNNGKEVDENIGLTTVAKGRIKKATFTVKMPSSRPTAHPTTLFMDMNMIIFMVMYIQWG